MTSTSSPRIVLADSITTPPDGAAGAVMICGSHGGALPAALALRVAARAIVLHDAGGGLGGAGRASLAICQANGMAACVAAAMSCRIGDAADMADRGVVSGANALAEACGVTAGMGVAAAARRLRGAPPPRPAAIPAAIPAIDEARRVIGAAGGGPEVILCDSASLVTAADRGAIVVTGSHGGLIGGDPGRALKADALIAFFNDAGMAADRSGAARLPALDARGVAAATAAAASARIGEAGSTLEDGVVSAVNDAAARLGVAIGARVKDVVARLRRKETP